MPSRTATIDAELAKVNIQMEILRNREDEIQKLIDGMQSLKDSIRGERLMLESRSRDLEAERYPVNRLPPELLAVIFANVVAYSTLDTNRDTATAAFAVPPPIILSQVCQRWRSVALATSSLWSKMLCWGMKSDGQLNKLFIHRSSTALLDVEYRTCPRFLPSMEGNEKENVSNVFSEIFDHSARLRSLSLECRAAEAAESVLGLLSTPIPSLQSLSLSIVTKHPSFSKAISLLEEPSFPGGDDDPNLDEPNGSNLTSLELEEVPLFSLPSHWFTNITTLKLRFLPKRHALPAGTPSYQLKMSTLCRFLALTPLLEDFTLSNTIPLFDTLLHDDNIGTYPGLSTRPRVSLPHLKRFEWSYPFPGEVHYFITFFDMPALEKLDIWVEEPRRATDWHISGHHNDLMLQASMRRGRSELWALRELSLQCDGENTFHTLRKFDVPSLQRLEITNADRRVRDGGKAFPTMPRLEYMLRDPRLSHLTHLTVSHLDITREPGRCEAFFGYLPVLTSLSLDTCVGVRRLMETLGEIVVGPPGLAPRYPERRRRIKVCPRLEAISLWSCEDVNVMDVCAVVMARLEHFDEDEKKTSSTDKVVQSTTRKIRPLRKSRRQIAGRNDEGKSSTHPVTGDLPGVLATSDFCRPAKIVYLRLDNCTGISFSDTFVLRQMGVVDIVYNGRALDA